MTLPRLLRGIEGGRPLSLAAHHAVHGPMPDAAGADLIDVVERAGLRGRGGASFPTAVKLRAVAAARGRSSVLVNAAEGEPMSAKDRTLLRLAPHLVLDGALVAAQAVGASRITVALPETAADALAAVRAAVRERGARNVSTVAVPVAYLAGEESALIRHLEGGPLKPTVVPPRPAERGLRRRPTLVQNPETLAHLALIARHGADWFRQVGTPADPGSTLITVSGAVALPGVQEIALGTPLKTVLATAGGAAEPLRAVLIGGYHGTWLPARAIEQLTLDDRRLLPHGGARLAAGVIVALGASACPSRELARAMAWLADQSAHQCGPCHNGLPAIAELLSAMVEGRGPSDGQRLLLHWSAQLPGRGACHLPDGATHFLASGLDVFAADLAEHEHHGQCRQCRRPSTLAVPRPAARRAAA